MEPQTAHDVLVAVISAYPAHILEASKALDCLKARGQEDPIFRKRIDNLLGNLPHPQTDSELAERRQWAEIIYGRREETRDKRLNIRLTEEELLGLHEKAAAAGTTLADWVRQKLDIGRSS